jgi:curved DNA-binding protein CbpA
MTAAAALVRLAFGPHATLYDALLLKDASITQVELKRAYRKAALRFHPDRANVSRSATDGDDTSNGDHIIKAMTLKFQAVSAAYEILMDPKRRASYDASGRVDDEEESHFHDTNSTASANSSSSKRNQNSENNNQRWEEFFQSVFNEIITGPAGYDATTYRGSDQERTHVLQHYETCKGDLNLMLQCVVRAKEADKERWMTDIIGPAIARGEVKDVTNSSGTKKKKIKKNDATLVESDDDADDVVAPKRLGKKRLRQNKSITKKADPRQAKSCKKKSDSVDLLDTDDEEDDASSSKRRQQRLNPSPRASVRVEKTNHKPAASTKPAMSKRDKLEYRVAKKRKIKAERELELAEIIKSKGWSGASGGAAKAKARTMGQRQQERPGTFSEGLLANLERKYKNK